MAKSSSKFLIPGLVVVAAVVAYVLWTDLNGADATPGIAQGNGRLEAVEIDVAAKAPGRIAEILVNEGELVSEGQLLARLDSRQLEASLKQAEAQLTRTELSVDSARIRVRQAEAEKRAADAQIEEAQASYDAAQKQYERTEVLAQNATVSDATLDSARAAALSAKAAIAASEAQSAAAEAGINSAQAAVVDAQAAVEAAQAQIDLIQVQIEDNDLVAPRDGRVQYLVAREGEIVAAGGRVINMVDLSDVYMSFFLPTAQAGRIGLDTEARILLDAVPNYSVPATISFVADVAQFTPKTVETEIEREKLMFRVRAKVDVDLLNEYSEFVKTGLPGVTYVRVDPQADWPADLPPLVPDHRPDDVTGLADGDGQ
ncbi:HlyD family secretion protein [Pseudooceanicola marinus]|uniref:HlyD family secretion protein n=1 Tax=Pseudooceanicola marinus TaxID=396013 RepID=UPI001CD1A4D7|nr:HlyD family efflux transporter periplasmic adaptor subunit [Pseudooceanicola marinus]MCA1334783.1 HlyD family efflux transporter periplasmic adaptor subunit [Pseudooceanicola marinus]